MSTSLFRVAEPKEDFPRLFPYSENNKFSKNSQQARIRATKTTITNSTSRDYFPSKNLTNLAEISQLSERFAKLSFPSLSSSSSTVFDQELAYKNLNFASLGERQKFLREALEKNSLDDTLCSIEKMQNGKEILKSLVNIWVIHSYPHLAMACLHYERSSSYANQILDENDASFIVNEFTKLPPTIRETLVEKLKMQSKDAALPTNTLQVENEKEKILLMQMEVQKKAEQMLNQTAFAITKMESYKLFGSFYAVRKDWQLLAENMAKYCFGGNKKIDVEKISQLKILLLDEKFAKNPPYSQIPSIRFIFAQVLGILDYLLESGSKLREILDNANDLPIISIGEIVLKAISVTAAPLTAAEGILQALFSLHRQFCTPTCTIDSYIISLMHDNPRQMAIFFKQILTRGYITFPSGYYCAPFVVKNDKLAINLQNGGTGKEAILEDFFLKGKTKSILANFQLKGWRFLPPSLIHIPLLNLIDVVFASAVQCTFGNKNINDINDYGTLYVFNGLGKVEFRKSLWEKYDASNYSVRDLIEKLKKSAEARRKLHPKIRYMRIGTKVQKDNNGHIESIDVDRLLQIDFDKMKNEEIYPFGDRNWGNSEESMGKIGEVIMLAVKKISKLDFRFGTLCGTNFTETQIYSFTIYPSHINSSTWRRKDKGNCSSFGSY
ncbi:MAG: hypothetical protein LBI56_02370 [Puniceicoccales bacterium]|jgi:hypothetical protein|nr:hypothetical protein [Puniceicoccales bacterium]